MGSREIIPSVYLGFGGSFIAKVLATSTYYKYWAMRVINNDLSIDQANDALPSPPTGWSSGDSLTLFGEPLIRQPSELPEGGSAVRLNGTSQYMASVYDETLSPSDIGPQSLEVLVTIHAVPGVGVEPAVMGGSTEFAVTARSDGRLYGYYNGAAVVDLPFTVDIPLHIVLTRSDASPDGIKLYVNNVVDTATPSNGTINRGYVHLGKHWTNAHYLSATYSWAGFYAAEMTAGQVALHYAATRWTDVTAEIDVMATVPIVIERGMKDDNPLARVAATGVATFALDNGETNSVGLLGYYTPGHVNCRSGFRKGIPCKISMTVGSTEYTQFVGRIRMITPVPDEYGERITYLTATDWMDEAARFRLAGVSIQEDVRADEVFVSLVDRMPNQPHGFTIHSCSETYEIALDNSRDEAITVLEEAVRLQASEVGRAWVSRDGRAVWESRFTRPAWHADVVADIETNMLALDAQETTDAASNRVQVTVHPRRVEDVASILFQLERPIKITSGQTIGFTTTYVSGASDASAATRIGGLDVAISAIAANAAEDGSGTDLTSALTYFMRADANSAYVNITSGHSADLWVTTLRLMGRAIFDFQPIVLIAEDPEAIASDGVNAVAFDMVYQEDAVVGDSIADALLAAYQSERIRARSVTLLANEDALPADLLSLDISDRIALNESMTALDAEYHINGIRIEFSESVRCDVTWWLATTAEGDALMAWQDVPYSAANFTANASTWGVGSADQLLYRWRRNSESTIQVQFNIASADIGAGNTYLRLAIPGGFLARNTGRIASIYFADVNTSLGVGHVVATAGASFVSLGREALTAWTTTTSDNTYVEGTFELEIQT